MLSLKSWIGISAKVKEKRYNNSEKQKNKPKMLSFRLSPATATNHVTLYNKQHPSNSVKSFLLLQAMDEFARNDLHSGQNPLVLRR
jgi:hypothetical protein